MTRSSDHNLLYGVLALQLDFISREQLVAAATTWVKDKSKSLGEILLDSGTIDASVHASLEQLVQLHLQRHDQDVERSLISCQALEVAIENLSDVDDPDLQLTLTNLHKETPFSRMADTATQVLGKATSRSHRFHVLRHHARGGLGEVFVAHDEELNRHVALKQIQSRFANDEASRARFTLEAEVTGGLEHPSIVPVYGLGNDTEGKPFYAMRFVRGVSLQDAIRQFHNDKQEQESRPDTNASFSTQPDSETRDAARPPAGDTSPFSAGERRSNAERTIEFRQLLGHLVDVCNAVEYAHNRSVLHRDLKPSNIMLGKYGETLVVDWGLAKPLGAVTLSDGEHQPTEISDEPALIPRSSDTESAETVMGQALGTPAYMSPEQAAGRIDLLGPACDVYSLGATLYTILTGQPPFAKQENSPILRRVETGDFPRPRSINPDLSPALEAICLKAMALHPNDRYLSSRDLADDIEAWLADQPTTAWPEPLTARLRRWLRQNHTLATSAAVAVLVAVVGLATLSAIVSAKNRELSAANRKLDAQGRQLVANNLSLKQANERSQAAEAKARDEAAVAVAVNTFLHNLLEEASPHEQPDPDIKLRTVIKRAGAGFGDQFAELPRVEAALRFTIGSTLSALGEVDEAEKHLLRFRELAEQLFGEAHQDTLVSWNELAEVYRQQGRFDEARMLYTEAARIGQETLGDHAVTLTSQSGLVNIHLQQNRIQEAETLGKQVLETRQRVLGEKHPDTLTSMHNLAAVFEDQQRYQAAEALFRKTLDLRLAVHGPDNPNTLATSSRLALLLKTLGRYGEALPLYEAGLTATRRISGDDHPDTLIAMNNLAMLYLAIEQYDEAMPLLEESLATRTKKFGPDDPQVLQAINNLARLHMALGNLDQAEGLYQDALEVARRTLGTRDLTTLACLNNLGTLYKSRRDYDRAEPLLKEATDTIRALLGDRNPNTLACMNNLAEVYMLQGQLEQAEPLLQSSYETLVQLLGETHPNTLTSMINLVNLISRQGKTDEAESLCRRAIELHSQKYGSTNAKTLAAQELLATILMQQEKFGEAAALFSNLIRNSPSDSTDPLQLALWWSSLATSQLRGDEFEKAANSYQECLNLYEQHKPDDWMRYLNLSLLGETLLGQAEFEESEQALLDGYRGLEARRQQLFPEQYEAQRQAAARRLVELYRAWEKPEQESKWLPETKPQADDD